MNSAVVIARVDGEWVITYNEEGFCSDPSHESEEDCEGKGNTWTPTSPTMSGEGEIRHFEFEGVRLTVRAIGSAGHVYKSSLGFDMVLDERYLDGELSGLCVEGAPGGRYDTSIQLSDEDNLFKLHAPELAECHEPDDWCGGDPECEPECDVEDALAKCQDGCIDDEAILAECVEDICLMQHDDVELAHLKELIADLYQAQLAAQKMAEGDFSADDGTGEAELCPTSAPTSFPSEEPTGFPSEEPSEEPSTRPSKGPTSVGFIYPTEVPTIEPTDFPSEEPSIYPSAAPTTWR